MVIAKKRFGQNFLTDPNKAVKLIDALSLIDGENVIEVGPGKGVLTEKILEFEVNLSAVEIDRDLIPVIRKRFESNKRFNIIKADIIKINPADYINGKFKLIGNLPYNISGAMIEWMIDNVDDISRAVITVQKEVGDRLKALPNNREYGSLSVLAQAYFKIEKLFEIPPGCFYPKPKVRSTALLFIPDQKLPAEISKNNFRGFLRNCFAKKRKTLLNSLLLSGIYQKELIEQSISDLGLKPDIRAEQLKLTDFITLYEKFRKYAD